MYRLILSLILSSAALLVSGARSEAVLELKEEVLVKGPKVFLSDLLEVEEGTLADRLAEVEISQAARPGSSKNINASLVEARLKTAGLKDVSVIGSARVRATTMHIDISREMVVASLQNHIETEMPWDPETTEVNIPFPLTDIVAPEGDMEIRWRSNPQYRYVGSGAFRGDVLIDGTVFRTVTMRANIEAYHEVVVAATDISRGRPIMASHLELQMMAVSKSPRGALLRIESAVGLLARRTIFPGQPVTSRVVEARKVIRRNQMVPVEVRSGRIRIQHRARAMMDGRTGDMIICANPSSKQEFRGVVRADGVVEVQQ